MFRYILNPSPAEPGYVLSFANSVDPDQLASEEAISSRSALFDIKYVNLYQQSWSSNPIGWKIRNGRGILIYSAGQGLNKSHPEN